MVARHDDPTVEPERARALIEEARPALRPVRVSPLGRGWDHDVHLANDEWVVRFPRHEHAARAVGLESALLPWLAPQLPNAIPVPAWDGALDASRGWRFIAHRLIAGQTVCDAELDADRRALLAPALARFVRALHSVPPTDSPVTLPTDPLRRLDVAHRGPTARTRVASWRHEGLLPDDAAARLLRILLETPPSAPPDEPLVIVHADLHTRNVLVSPTGHLAGVIDWVDVHWGHAALDLATAFEILPPDAREIFFANYGEVSANTRGWSHWRAVEQTAGALAGARERGDEAFARASRRALIEMSVT